MCFLGWATPHFALQPATNAHGGIGVGKNNGRDSTDLSMARII